MFAVHDLSNSVSSIDAGSTSNVDLNLKNCDTGAEMCLYYDFLTTSSLAIVMHASMDGVTFRDAVTAYNVSVGAVATAADATAHSRFIQLTPVYAPYVRFAVTISETTSSFGAFTVSYQEA